MWWCVVQRHKRRSVKVKCRLLLVVEPVVEGVVEMRVLEDHVEIVQRVVEDHEVAVVELSMDEDQAQTRSQS